MSKKSQSVLVIGFNTRPLAYSLNRAGYKVYAVDFFGDLDLYPFVEDCIIVTKRWGNNYKTVKDNYSDYLVEYGIEMLKKYPDIDYYLIGSGLDDNFEGRRRIIEETIKTSYDIQVLNNGLPIIIKARNINAIYELLKSRDYKFPPPKNFEEINSLFDRRLYPYILKKKSGSGGINVFKISNQMEFDDWLIIQTKRGIVEPSDWILQEYIEGIPLSCTIISNGISPQVVSVNRQIIGLDELNPPQRFMYCGNVVPSNLDEQVIDKIKEISLWLSKELGLVGINGFDFVLKDTTPYFMEINPRIPGSIRCSEEALKINLLEFHVESFINKKWDDILDKLNSIHSVDFATKMIFFTQKKVSIDKIKEINKMDNIFDKTEPNKVIDVKEPVCSVLYKSDTYSKSYNGALNVIKSIKNIIERD